MLLKEIAFLRNSKTKTGDSYMRVTTEHHKIAETLYKENLGTISVRQKLMSRGLSQHQANSACKTARKHLGLYVSDRKKRKAQEKIDKEQARRFAEQEMQNRSHREAVHANSK